MSFLFLLIGAVALGAAWAAVRETDVPHPFIRVAAGVTVAVLALLQVLGAARRFDRYRISVLGTRTEITDRDGYSLPVRLRLDGNRDSADFHIPAAPDRALGWIVPVADTAGRLDRLDAACAEDGDVFLLHRRDREDWHPLRAVPLGPEDTVVVRTLLGPRRLVAQSFRDSRLRLGHRIVDVDSARSVRLPIREPGLRVLRTGRSLWRQSHPLADVFRVLDGKTEDPPVDLTSVLYHDGDQLYLLDLDSEVKVVGPAIAVPDSVLWRPDGSDHRIRVAAVPRRDIHDPDLTLPDRGGVRVLYTARLTVAGRWLEVTPDRPEVRAIGHTELERLSGPLPGSRGTAAWRLRVTGDPESVVPNAVALSGLPTRLASSVEAYLELPQAAGTDSFTIRTPVGLHEWALGHPLPLGRSAGPQAVIRVDRQAVGWGYAAVLVLALLIPVAALALPSPSAAWALAVAVFGLACIRLLCALSVFLEFPYLDDAYSSALWVPALLTCAVVLLGDAGRRLRREPAGDDPDGAPPSEPWWPRAALAAATVGLVALLAGWGIALAFPVVLLAAYAFSLSRPAPALLARAGQIGLDSILLAALLMLVLRYVAWFLGMREQIPLGGNRFAISIVYTPVALLLLIGLLDRLNRLTRTELPDRSAARERAKALTAAWRARPWRLDRPARALLVWAGGPFTGWLGRRWASHGLRVHTRTMLLGIGAYLVAAFGLIGMLVSDFGLTLLAIAGIAVFLLCIALRLPRNQVNQGQLAAALVLPAFLFLFVELRPDAIPGVGARVADRAETLRFREWNPDDLRLLDRAAPEAVERIGHTRSEALVVMRRTMEAYTRRPGHGFLNGEITRPIAATAPREHVPSAVVAAQWGLSGSLCLVVLLMALMLPVAVALDDPGDPGEPPLRMLLVAGALLASSLVLPSPFGPLLGWVAVLGLVAAAWRAEASQAADAGPPLPLPQPARAVAAIVLLSMGMAGLYMVVANHGVGLFTGKNVYLLGLDSDSDIVESLVLLSLAALALGLGDSEPDTPDARSAGQSIYGWRRINSPAVGGTVSSGGA